MMPADDVYAEAGRCYAIAFSSDICLNSACMAMMLFDEAQAFG